MDDFLSFFYNLPMIVKIIIGIPVTALVVYIILFAPIRYTSQMIRLIKKGRK